MTEKSTIICEAVYSEDKSHRFIWKRVWDSKKPVLCVITLNPNSDNVFELDLTSMLVTNNTYRLGSYGGVTVVNLFSCITDRLRKDDFDEENSIAEENIRYIKKAAKEAESVVIAWGKSANSKPSLGRYPISALNVSIIQNWVNDIYKHPPTAKNDGAPLSPKTVKNIFLNLQAALNYAVFMKLIPDNPCSHVNLPPLIHHEVEAFDEEDIRKILVCAKGTDLYFPIYLLIHTGMRRGELLGLKWENVHLEEEHPYIDIVQTRLSACGKEVIDTPKTESSKRKIYLSSQAKKEFIHYRLWSKEVLLRYGKIQSSSDFVIIREDGKLDEPNNFTRRWNKFLEQNRIRQLKLHGLRHTCATMLLKNNVDIKTISNRLGHSDTSMVLNVYGHSLDSMSQAAADSMDRIMNIS